MASLDLVINSIFNYSNSNSMITRRFYGRSSLSAHTTTTKHMEIPISSKTFELPLFAFEGFKRMNIEHRESSTIVASLFSCGLSSDYKSLDSIMKDVLSTRFDKHLCKIRIPNSPNVYYATFGAVFDENLTPLMMLSWIMERKANANGVVKYHYKKPLLRLNPYPCLNKEDTLQKFICGRWMTTALGCIICAPIFYDCDNFIEQPNYSQSYHVKVEIDECPFTIRSTDVPSISVTNEELLQLAADHIDEVLQ